MNRTTTTVTYYYRVDAYMSTMQQLELNYEYREDFKANEEESLLDLRKKAIDAYFKQERIIAKKLPSYRKIRQNDENTFNDGFDAVFSVSITLIEEMVNERKRYGIAGESADYVWAGRAYEEDVFRFFGLDPIDYARVDHLLNRKD